MISLKALQAKNTKPEQLLLQGAGYGLWTAWHGEPNPVFVQTLEDYGGFQVVKDDHQALWFFFTDDVFMAAAKLGVWSQFNTLPVTMQIFEARVQCSPEKHFYIDIADDLWAQTVEDPLRLQVFVLPEMLGSGSVFTGINLAEAVIPSGFSKREWRLAVPDQRRQYQPTHNWFCVLKPAEGNHDRAYQIGWRDFYGKLHGLMQRSKIKHNNHGDFVVMGLGSFRQIKQWCKDYLNLVHRLKGENDGAYYWPCVMGMVDSKGFTLNSELPKQIGLDWDTLMPDSPYMALQYAILLGDEFIIHQARLSQGRNDPDAWCSVSLDRGEEEGGAFRLPDLAPASMVAGVEDYCFYCGQRSHATVNCPSKTIKDVDLRFWNKLSAMNLNDMKEGVAEINARVLSAPSSVEDLLSSGGLAGMIAQAVFGIGATFQWRSIPLFWRVRGKIYPQALAELKAEDDSPMWDFIKEMSVKDLSVLDKELQHLEVRYPRDYRVFSIRGFIAMEMKNFALAKKSWEEAQLLSHPGVMQAWHFMLLGRLAEYQGQYAEARQSYDHVLETTPSWAEAKYRRLICAIKSGFIDQSMLLVRSLVREEPVFFNWFLMDPEVERAAAPLREALSREWSSAALVVGEEKLALLALQKELLNWFLPEHDFLNQANSIINKLLELSGINNYVAYMTVLRGRGSIEKDMQSRINAEVKEFKTRFNNYVAKLNNIRDEAAWFPFPKALVEFNKNYNAAATNLNWIMRSNMHVADIFRKAQELSETEKERLEKMERRMKLLRVIRDGTLFGLVLVKKFLWIELIGLALILAVFPLAVYYGNKSGMSWVSSIFVDQQWEIQKGAILLVSLVAVLIAGLWTVLRFEVIRDKIFEKARLEEERKAKERSAKMEQIMKARSAKRKQAMDAAKAAQGRRNNS